MKAERQSVILLLIIVVMFLDGGATASAHANRPVIEANEVATAGERYVRTELYFGLGRKGAADVSEEEFQRFVDEFVTPRFPDGLTVVDARGQWRVGDSTVTKERSKVLIVIYRRKDRRIAGTKIEEIRNEYKKRFAQSSMMRVDMGKSLEVSF